MAGILSAIEISSHGLSVQRAKMNATAKNIANAETTETPAGGPYRRERVQANAGNERTVFSAVMKQAGARLNRTHSRHIKGEGSRIRRGVEIPTVTAEKLVDPPSSFRLVHDPSHPQADEQGYVRMPDIEIVNEMVDMMTAARAYEANTVAISTAKQMAKNALDI